MTDLRMDVRTVLDDFELGIDLDLDFQRLGIFGPSGSGKTTILDILAGLREPEYGRIVLDDTVWFDRDRSIDRAPEVRRIGYLMQDARLFPHRTVEENLRFGGHHPKRVSLDKLVDILEIGPLMERTPDTLSGGERRRVALAQVLNAGPDLLLLDEPLTGLNESLRAEVLPAIRRVIARMEVPSIVVSHRPVIMRSLADTIVPLNRGRASGSYEVSRFFQNNRLRDRGILGETNYYEVTIREVDSATGLLRGETEAGLSFQLLPAHGLGTGDRALVSFSSREPIIGTTEPESLSPRNHWRASVDQVESEKGSALLTLELDGETVWVRVTDETIRELGVEPGQSIDVLIKSHSLNVRTL